VNEILLTAGIINFLSKNLALDILQTLYIKSGWQAQRAETFVKKGKAFRTSRCSAPTQVFMNNTDWKYVGVQLQLRFIGLNIFIHLHLPMYQIQNIELF
jgi:hypothetical protein